MQIQIIEWYENDVKRSIKDGLREGGEEGGNRLSVKISPIDKVNSTMRRLSPPAHFPTTVIVVIFLPAKTIFSIWNPENLKQYVPLTL